MPERKVVFFVASILVIIVFVYYKTREGFRGDIVTVDENGNLESKKTTTSLFYCDGSSKCVQPFPLDEIRIGTWTLSENREGHLVISKKNAVDNVVDQGFFKFSADGNISLSRSTAPGWIAVSLNSTIKPNDRVALRSWRGNHLNNDGKNGTTWSSSLGDWETFTLLKR
jgi:hypothetical protein